VILLLAVVLASAQIHTATMEEKFVQYGESGDRFVTTHGKLWMIISDTAAPQLTFYDQIGATWREVLTGDTAETISAAWNFGSDVTLGDNEDDDVTIDGQLTKRVYRQDFDCMAEVVEEDWTAEVGTDAGVNRAIFYCGDRELSMIHFRIDGAQSTPIVISGPGTATSALDIDNDGTDNEGVELVFAEDTQTTDWIADFGEAWYMRVGFTITSIDGTDNLQIGWKINGDFVDDLVIGTINTYGAFYWNSTAGNCVLAAGDDGADTTDEITGCDLSDAESMVVEVSFTTGGLFDFTYAATEAALESATASTQVNTLTAAFTTGEVMVPYIALLNAAAADTELAIDFIEVGQVQ